MPIKIMKYSTLEEWESAYKSLEKAYEDLEESWCNLDTDIHSVLEELKECKKELVRIKIINNIDLNEDDKEFIKSVLV